MYKLLVYGTLRQGQGNNRVLARHKATYINTITLSGYDMFSCGGHFPGVVEGKGTITCEVFEIDEDCLKDCDGLEGYVEQSPGHSLYIRKVVNIPNLGDCFIYVWARTASTPSIPSGDWLEYQHRKAA